MPRIVLDTNVLISELLHEGRPAKIVDLAINGDFQLLTSLPLKAKTWLISACDEDSAALS
jgi:predicted nucleic acid-binding protein